MNALLNYNMSSSFPPSLGFNQPANFGAYQNFMTPSFSGTGVGIDSLQSALSNVPMGTYGNYGNALSFPSSQPAQSNLKNLLEEGIISDEEYRSQLRRMNGIMSSDDIKKLKEERTSAYNEPSQGLYGEELKAARNSNTGDYKVTEEHSEVANQYMDATKEILKKEPEMMTEKDIQSVEKIFAELNKNPMLAEAFVKEANETTLSGKTTTVLGRLEQALTKQQGQKAAKEIMSEIKENLKQNVEGRNPELWSEFEEKSNADSKNVEYSKLDKIMHNPAKALGYGIAGTAAVVGTYKVAKSATKLAVGAEKFATIAPKFAKAGKFGLLALAVGAAAYGTYKLCSSETD